MGTARVTQTFPVAPAEAERRWYDTRAWATWVQGLETIVAVEPGWPSIGAAVVWESGPAGRGRVTERVVAYEAGAGQTVEVTDVSITGRQSVVFAAATDGVAVTLSLSYRVTRRSPLTPLIDVLFIRRAMIASLRETLERFGGRLGDGRLDFAGPSAARE